MKPIAEITDRCLEMMKPHELFNWEDWWDKIIQNGDMPTNKTWAYYKFIIKRNKVKERINNELKARNLPDRLICIGQGKGLYLLNEKGTSNITETSIDTRVTRAVHYSERTIKVWNGLSNCPRISDEDKRKLTRMSDVFEAHLKGMIGTLAGMKSLPALTKKRLLKHLGFNGEEK